MTMLNCFLYRKKVGYKDELNHQFIAPIYDGGPESFGKSNISRTRNQYATVSIGGYFGIINSEGDIIVPLEYEDARYLFDDLFAICKKGENKFGVINFEGDIIIPFDFKYITSDGHFIKCYSEANRTIKIRQRYSGYIGPLNEYTNLGNLDWYNKQGTLIYTDKDSNAYACGKFLRIKSNKKFGLVDDHGKIKISCNYDEIRFLFGNYYMVRKGDNKEWATGIIDEDGNLIIDLKYKYIEQNNNSIFHCFNIGGEYIWNLDRRSLEYRFLHIYDEKWITVNGNVLYEGEAIALPCNLLAIKRVDKWGLINYEGNYISNFVFDAIKGIGNIIIVAADSKIGLLDDEGHTIVPALYKQIESTYAAEEDLNQVDDVHKTLCYNQQNKFDTLKTSKRLAKSYVAIKQYSHKLSNVVNLCSLNSNSEEKITEIETENPADFTLDRVLILYDGYEKCIFDPVSKSVISNSNYDNIEQIASNIFVVEHDGLYGLYNTIEKKEILPCKYDRIQYEGNHIIYICKNDLWGACSIQKDKKFSKVDIDAKYYEIKALNSKPIFGVKIKNKYNDYYEYTIINNVGEHYKRVDALYRLSSQFTYFNDNKILTSNRHKKYGFISVDGYVSIPFKYDEVNQRKDGDFNVRIGNRWGILCLNGNEKTLIKYSEVLPDDLQNKIVQDEDSKCYGVIESSGREKIPTIYPHLFKHQDECWSPNEDEDQGNLPYYIAYGGYKSKSGIIEGASWGCLSSKGELIVKPTYDFVEKLSNRNLIVACRDGHMNGTDNIKNYIGKIDMYSSISPKLIIGGFNYIDYDKEYLFLHFGPFKRGGRWVAIDKDANSVIRKADKGIYKFSMGFIGKVIMKEKEGKKILYWNIPLDILSVDEPLIKGKYILVSNGKKWRAQNIASGETTLYYEKVSPIQNTDYVFLFDKWKVGLSISGKVVAEIKYEAITYPVDGVFFAIRRNEENKKMGNIILYYSKNSQIKNIEVIKEKELDILFKYLLDGELYINKVNYSDNIIRVTINNDTLLDKKKYGEIELTTSSKKTKYTKNKYWYSSIDILKKQQTSNQDYYDNNNDNDYLSDSWDAMTEGNYGDMPDGFDGDFDFLGQ